jgi:macrodomain Ter protein organizer (MatP/YcbG family)/DNA-binding transcriptional ArsR family regulator
VIANQLIDLDPVWSLIIGGSSGGKSTLLAPLVNIEKVHFVDDVTEKTFLSGYKVKGKSASLLQMIGSGMMIFSDFTSILSKNHVSRGEILSQFRLIYDRKLVKHTGTGSVKWEGKMGVLAGATPEIYYHLESGQAMGERWIYYFLDVPSDEAMSKKQSTTNTSAKDITDIMSIHYKDYYNDVRDWIEKHGVPKLNMNEHQRERVRQASMFCVEGKTTVHTNFKSGKIDQIPNKASVGRDFKSFEAILLAFQIMYCYETGNPDASVQDWMLDITDKCSYCSINRERRAILEILARTKDHLSASQIGSSDGFGLEKQGVELYLAPLFAVGLIKRDVSSNSFKWYMEDGPKKDFVNKVANAVPRVKLKEDEEMVELSEHDQEVENIWDSM